MLEEFGARLKSMRERKGLSQEQLAELVGVSLSSLRAYEKIVNDSSRNKPPIDTIIKIADTLDVSLDYLCRGKDEHLKGRDVVPVLRAFVDVMELFSPRITVQSHEAPYPLMDDVITSASLSFPGFWEAEERLGQDGEKSSEICVFISKYKKLVECGLKNIDKDLYDKTLDTFVSCWEGYKIHNNTLVPRSKVGDPNGSDKKEE